MAERVHFLRGEIDLSNAQEVDRRIDRAIRVSDGELVIDCYDLTFIDSSGIAVLVRAEAELRSTGRSLRVANANEMTRRLFELLGVNEILGVNSKPPTRAEVDSHDVT